MTFFTTTANNTKIYTEPQKTLKCQTNLEKKKNKTEGITLPDFYTMLQSYSHQNSMVLAQKQKYRSKEQDRRPRNKPMRLWSINL